MKLYFAPTILLALLGCSALSALDMPSAAEKGVVQTGPRVEASSPDAEQYKRTMQAVPMVELKTLLSEPREESQGLGALLEIPKANVGALIEPNGLTVH